MRDGSELCSQVREGGGGGAEGRLAAGEVTHECVPLGTAGM